MILTDVPAKPTEIEADKYMELLSKQLGGRWGAVKLGGYWVIGTYDEQNKWKPMSGGHNQPSTRSFRQAIANATGMQVAK